MPVRVKLSTGETEVLMTTLLDTYAYPAEEFKAVYGARWNEETFFNRLKNIFELERFRSGPLRGRGYSVLAINQDVQGIFFTCGPQGPLPRSKVSCLMMHNPLSNRSRFRTTPPCA